MPGLEIAVNQSCKIPASQEFTFNMGIHGLEPMLKTPQIFPNDNLWEMKWETDRNILEQLMATIAATNIY